MLVARDQLGVLSHVLTCAESARARGLAIAGLVLSRHPGDQVDPSLRTNHRILEARLDCPIRVFPTCLNPTGAELAGMAEGLGLPHLLALA